MYKNIIIPFEYTYDINENKLVDTIKMEKHFYQEIEELINSKEYLVISKDKEKDKTKILLQCPYCEEGTINNTADSKIQPNGLCTYHNFFFGKDHKKTYSKDKPTYKVDVICTNCDQPHMNLQIQFGQPITETKCNNCGCYGLKIDKTYHELT